MCAPSAPSPPPPPPPPPDPTPAPAPEPTAVAPEMGDGKQAARAKTSSATRAGKSALTSPLSVSQPSGNGLAIPK